MGIVWEIDFYSRPILDDNGKKRWELLVCESPLTTTRSTDSLFRFSRYCPSSTVNSAWLAESLTDAMKEAAEPPTKIRFFRRQMNNLITKAAKDLGIDANISRRTAALYQWLEERLETVYPQDPNYDAAAAQSPSVRYQPQAPKSLPDALEGQKWAFVTLTAKDFADFDEWEMDFSEGFPLELLDLDPETRVPGVIVFSPRAFPLAAWMSGLELGFLKFVTAPNPQLVLETGADDSWRLANITDDRTLSEAKGFESVKEQARGVHFLAIQSDPNAESFAGFWLLPELNLT
ncbi:Tab2/Atab2 family RNA-binding protein [Baaleninema sp.]|uniref:Tab2/Atab2 family RNA-binding protein n=1 Tax=Baaleninema sp. TaxID=3101197 RepID=UPI003D02F7A4